MCNAPNRENKISNGIQQTISRSQMALQANAINNEINSFDYNNSLSGFSIYSYLIHYKCVYQKHLNGQTMSIENK